MLSSSHFLERRKKVLRWADVDLIDNCQAACFKCRSSRFEPRGSHIYFYYIIGFLPETGKRLGGSFNSVL